MTVQFDPLVQTHSVTRTIRAPCNDPGVAACRVALAAVLAVLLQLVMPCTEAHAEKFVSLPPELRVSVAWQSTWLARELGSYASSIVPLAGVGISAQQINRAIAEQLGMSSLDGFDANSAMHLLIAELDHHSAFAPSSYSIALVDTHFRHSHPKSRQPRRQLLCTWRTACQIIARISQHCATLLWQTCHRAAVPA
jgi:hypothetical protein